MKSLLGCLVLVCLAGCKGSTETPTAEAPALETPTAEAPAKAPPAAVVEAPITKRPPGVKPHYVECDPARPDMPCTPDVDRVLELAPAPSGLKTIAKLGEGRTEQAIRGCQTEADCVVTCIADGHCCPDLCDCQITYNKTFFSELKGHRADCTMKGCPKAKCSDTGYDWVPSCVEGICGVRKQPY